MVSKVHVHMARRGRRGGRKAAQRREKGISVYRLAAIGIAIIVVAVLALAILSGGQHAYAGSGGLVNIDTAGLQAVFGSAVNYSVVEANNVTTFDYPASNQSGLSTYKAVSVSEFNANVSYQSRFPVIITSALYELSNSTSAAQMVQEIVRVGRQPTYLSGGISINSSSAQANYTYNGRNISIYSTYAVEVLNSSYIPAASVYPIYQYTSMFQYGKYAAIVTTNGYTYLSYNVSLSLAELLFRKMVSSGIAGS